MHFMAKHLAYIPKVWHHFITSRVIPMTNVCEVTPKRALLNYAIIQDNPFDVEQVIEDAILYNRDDKMKNKQGVPRPDEVYDSRHNPSDEHELKAYQTQFGIREYEKTEVGQSSTQPPPAIIS